MEQNRTRVVGASAEEDSKTTIRKGPRWRAALAALAIIPAFALFAGARDAQDEGIRLHVETLTKANANVGTCTAAGTDNNAYGLTGYKFGSSALAYKIKTASYPTYLTSADVTSAITTSFSAWDAGTAKALFTNGGVTTALVNKKDGTSTVGFTNLSSGTVGTAYAWTSGSTIIEFDIALSTGYQWDLNKTQTGDCGGVASKFDVRNIMMHEVGHPLGLNDKSTTADHAQTMHGFAAYQELYKRTIANGDKAGLNYLYGP